ncbi:hypothetical protein ACFL59_13410 [Planctomycetota bacterium]
MSEQTPQDNQDADLAIREVRTQAEFLPLRALEKRGFRKVRVLNMKTIERIISQTVDHALERRSTSLASTERAEIEEEAKRELLQLMKEHKKLAAQKTEADKRKDELETQVDGLRDELQRQQQALLKEQERSVAAHEVTFTPTALQEMEEKIRVLFKQLMSEERRLSLAEAGPRALRGLSEFERDLVTLIDRIMAELRDRYLDRERAEHNKKIDLLERRIAKLNKALKHTEQALHTVAKAKSIDPGVASIYDTIQGLSYLDPAFQRKNELLKEVFLQNLELQGKEIRPDDYVAVTPTPGAAAPGPPVPPSDFRPPIDSITSETAF